MCIIFHYCSIIFVRLTVPINWRFQVRDIQENEYTADIQMQPDIVSSIGLLKDINQLSRLSTW